MVISSNILAMNAQRQFGITTDKKKKTTEKLSSGYKINRATDDAAGLTISEKMRRQIRGLDQGARNTQDGISLLQVADGALNEVHDMLHRMNELAIKAANGTNTIDDRRAIQQEIAQIKDEIGRVGDTTSFNNIMLFKGETETRPVMKGEYKATNVSGISYTNVEEISADRFSVTVEYDNVVGSSGNPKVTVGSKQYTISQTYESLMNQVANGEIHSSNMSVPYNYNLIINPQIYGEKQSWGELIGRRVTEEGNWYHYNERGFYRTVLDVRFQNASAGWSEYNVDMNNLPCLKDANGEETRITVGLRDNIKQTRHDYVCMKDDDNNGIDDENPNMITADKYIDYIKRQLINNNSNKGKEDASVELIEQGNDHERYTFKFEVTKPEEIEAYKTYTSDLSLWIQSGAENGDGIYLIIPHVDENVIGVKDVSVLSDTSAGKAIGKISSAIRIISEARSRLGAQQNRLEHTYKNVTNIAENTQAAESRIRDTDMAKEMVELSKQNILEQVGTSMITQANQSNQGVLNLLQ